MPEPKAVDMASLLYLATTLPTMRQRSDEAALLVEAAIVECLISISGSRKVFREQLDLVAMLRYALDDMAMIAPVSAGLLQQAMNSLSEKRRNGETEANVVH